jgi:hypothetical protein
MSATLIKKDLAVKAKGAFYKGLMFKKNLLTLAFTLTPASGLLVPNYFNGWDDIND